MVDRIDPRIGQQKQIKRKKNLFELHKSKNPPTQTFSNPSSDPQNKHPKRIRKGKKATSCLKN